MSRKELKGRVIYGRGAGDATTDGPHPLSSRPLKYKTWSEPKMAQALDAVTREGMSIREAALQFGVPKSTLGDRVSGKVLSGATSGPQTYLDHSEEEELVQFLLRCAEIGYAKSRKQVLALVRRLLQKKGMNAPVTNGWWESFCSRHPNLTLRAPAPLSKARAAASDPAILDRYFDLLEDVLQENDLLGRACQIFNMDETGMPLDAAHVKVVTQKGDRNPTAPSSGDKAQLTVVACVSAAGSFMPPMVILDRKTLPPRFTEGEVPGTVYGMSSKGWIDQELFDGWFSTHFLKYAPLARPLLLLLDGHSSHYCPDTVRLAAKERVIIFALPPNTTHLTQPLDKGCFGPLKAYWREECHNFMSDNPGKIVNRYIFSKLLSKVWSKAMSIHNIMGGFKVCGIYPFNRHAVSLPLKEKPKQMEALAEKSGLAYIPLFSPAKGRSSHRHRSEFNDSLSPRCRDSSPINPSSSQCRQFSRSSSIHRGRSSSRHRNLKRLHASSQCHRASSVCGRSSRSSSVYHRGRSSRSSSVHHRGRSSRSSSAHHRGRSSRSSSAHHRGRSSRSSSVHHRGRSSRSSVHHRGRSSRSSSIHRGRFSHSSVHRGRSSRSSIHRGRCSSSRHHTIRLGRSQHHCSSSARHHHASSHRYHRPSSQHQRSSSIRRGRTSSRSLSDTRHHSLSSPYYLSSDRSLSPYLPPFQPHIVTSSRSRRSSSFPKYRSSSPHGLQRLKAHGGSLSALLTPPVKEKIKKTPPKRSCGRILTSLENMKAIEEKEQNKKEKLRLKEERKRQLEQKRQEKEQIAVEKKRQREAKKIEKSRNKISTQEQRKTDKQYTCTHTCTKKGKHGMESTFTEQEIKLFETRLENGYDLESDKRYNEWLKMREDGLTDGGCSAKADELEESILFDLSFGDLYKEASTGVTAPGSQVYARAGRRNEKPSEKGVTAPGSQVNARAGRRNEKPSEKGVTAPGSQVYARAGRRNEKPSEKGVKTSGSQVNARAGRRNEKASEKKGVKAPGSQMNAQAGCHNEKSSEKKGVKVQVPEKSSQNGKSPKEKDDPASQPLKWSLRSRC